MYISSVKMNYIKKLKDDEFVWLYPPLQAIYEI